MKSSKTRPSAIDARTAARILGPVAIAAGVVGAQSYNAGCIMAVLPPPGGGGSDTGGGGQGGGIGGMYAILPPGGGGHGGGTGGMFAILPPGGGGQGGTAGNGGG